MKLFSITLALVAVPIFGCNWGADVARTERRAIVDAMAILRTTVTCRGFSTVPAGCQQRALGGWSCENTQGGIVICPANVGLQCSRIDPAPALPAEVDRGH